MGEIPERQENERRQELTVPAGDPFVTVCGKVIFQLTQMAHLGHPVFASTRCVMPPFECNHWKESGNVVRWEEGDGKFRSEHIHRNSTVFVGPEALMTIVGYGNDKKAVLDDLAIELSALFPNYGYWSTKGTNPHLKIGAPHPPNYGGRQGRPSALIELKSLWPRIQVVDLMWFRNQAGLLKRQHYGTTEWWEPSDRCPKGDFGEAIRAELRSKSRP